MIPTRPANDPVPGPREQRPAGISRLAVALTLSLALHALLVLALGRVPRALPRPPRRDIPFELVPRAPPSRAPAPAAPERTGKLGNPHAPAAHDRSASGSALVRSRPEPLPGSRSGTSPSPSRAHPALAPGDGAVTRSWFRSHGLSGAAPNPLAVVPPPSRASADRNRDRESLRAGLDRLGASGTGPEPWALDLVAVVRVEQDRDGTVKRVALARGSGNTAYDRRVVAHARRLAGRSLAPRLAGTITEWAFATEVRMAPLVPVAGFGFDAYFRPTGVSYPLKRTVRTRVELRSVRSARAAG